VHFVLAAAAVAQWLVSRLLTHFVLGAGDVESADGGLHWQAHVFVNWFHRDAHWNFQVSAEAQDGSLSVI